MMKVSPKSMHSKMIGHLDGFQFFSNRQHSEKTTLTPSDKEGEWDVTLGFMEDAKRLVALKRKVHSFQVYKPN
jgi:hypothetical protein